MIRDVGFQGRFFNFKVTQNKLTSTSGLRVNIITNQANTEKKTREDIADVRVAVDGEKLEGGDVITLVKRCKVPRLLVEQFPPEVIVVVHDIRCCNKRVHDAACECLTRRAGERCFVARVE